MARGAAPVHSVALTRLFSEKMSRFSVIAIAPFGRSVDGKARFYVHEESGKCTVGASNARPPRGPN
jgi:hypothetical protein